MLNLPVERLPQIKKERSALLAKLGIVTLQDLIRHFPRGYEDRSSLTNIMTLTDGEKALVKAKVISPPTYRYIRKNMNLVKVKVLDNSGIMEITYFNQKYMMNQLEEGKEYLFYGKAIRKWNKVEMTNPITEPEERHTGGIMPIYSLTKGLSGKVFSNLVKSVLAQLDPLEEETLPDYLLQTWELCDILFAYENIHFPRNQHALAVARRRLIFEELLYFQLGLLKLKRFHTHQKGIPFHQFKIVEELAAILPFPLTNAQKRVIREIAADIKNQKQLNRLVQGDVGSGKTIVACSALLLGANSGYQGALLAPTEVLATQHYEEMKTYFSHFNLSCALLTGSTGKKDRKQILEELASGKIRVLIGTHAILEEEVIFSNLAICVTDEQHRFGVKQRNRLYEKGDHPHMLVMSATPIPRTLALIMHSDLDISIIDEMPPNRKKVETILAREKDRPEIDRLLSRELANNSQVYVVCPLVEETEHSDGELKSVTDYNEVLKKKFPDYEIALLHGKMKPEEKDRIMMDFKSGKIRMLISTTVIEVGVNVPNATVMLIENADRFGLSQLHQLRGRVGRGEKKSYAVLVTDLTAKTTMERMKIMVKTNDGFEISEKDLELRGPGDFFGTEQSGFLDLEIANLMKDVKILHEVSNLAKEILKEDMDLKTEKNELLRKNVLRLFQKNGVSLFN